VAGTAGSDIVGQLVGYLPKLRRFAYGLTGSIDEGDDLLQSACERALARTDQFEPGTRFDSWMYRILQTLWIDRLRSRKRSLAVADSEALERYPGGDVAVETEARMTLAQVRREIARLVPEQRSVLLLVSVEGLSYREAAEVLGVPIGTVMSRLARARLSLGRALSEEPSAEADNVVQLRNAEAPKNGMPRR
jgi:RNA polymerase sigma-70 factor (ECF subfamily)